MSDQPEALRLADAISAALRPKASISDPIRPEASLPPADWARAAAVLRLLHDLNVDKTEIISALSAEVERLRAATRAALAALENCSREHDDADHVDPDLRAALGDEK